MSPSTNCYDFIKKEEGCVLRAYQDQAGIWTIGIGSTMYRDGRKVKRGDAISMEVAMDLLRWEVNNKATAVNACIGPVKINQNQFDALVSFTYNCGVGALQQSTLLRRVKANPQDPSIREAFGMWNKITVGGKKVANAGLTARRRREADLYFS